MIKIISFGLLIVALVVIMVIRRKTQTKFAILPSEGRLLTRKEITKQLKRLSQAKPPKNLSMGAMCYEVAIKEHPNKVEYICSVCGERTIYNKNEYSNTSVMDVLEYGLSACRREITKITNVNIQLNDTQFCKNCSPHTIVPELCLKVQIDGEQIQHSISNVSFQDLRILREFFEGKIVHTEEEQWGIEEPLVDYIDRISELLGVQVKL